MNQATRSKSATPCSISVGTSGAAALRTAPLAPSARSLPALICGIVAAG
jgi:hypothetical protein